MVDTYFFEMRSKIDNIHEIKIVHISYVQGCTDVTFFLNWNRLTLNILESIIKQIIF